MDNFEVAYSAACGILQKLGQRMEVAVGQNLQSLFVYDCNPRVLSFSKANTRCSHQRKSEPITGVTKAVCDVARLKEQAEIRQLLRFEKQSTDISCISQSEIARGKIATVIQSVSQSE